MVLKTRCLIVGLSVYAVFCAAMMFVLPMNAYEWMLDDPLLRDDELTFCGLPLDDGIDVRFLTFIVLLPLFVAGGALSVRARRMHYAGWLALAVLVVWVWRFLIHYPLCPGRETF